MRFRDYLKRRMKGRNSTALIGATVAILAATLPVSTAHAAVPEKLVASFSGTNGNQPYGLSMDPSGNLWGVTLVGGNGICNDQTPLTGCGTVFEMTPSSTGWSTRLIYQFKGGHDGEGPFGPLAFDGSGNVYGITNGGGHGFGTVFKLSLQSGRYQESILYRFNPTRTRIDGSLPLGGVVIDAAGNLFGTTYYGGGPCDCGTVFEVSPSSSGAWTESILYSFQGPFGSGSADGSYPYYAGLVLDASGNIYGTTGKGGSGPAGGAGTIFKLSPAGGGIWTENILYNFQGGSAQDGNQPAWSLIFDSAGNLYGTTLSGGGSSLCNGFDGCGTVFQLSPSAGGMWTESILHTFSLHDGQGPSSGLVFDHGGNLYGVTGLGGFYSGGAAFELVPSSGGVWTESILHSFGNGVDGSTPVTPLVIDSAGRLYGGTATGGHDTSGPCSGYWPVPGCGTVFQLTP